MITKISRRQLIGLSFVICHLSFSVALTSCGEDFLDKQTNSDYTVPQYFSSDEAVIKAVNPLYNRAWHEFNRRSFLNMGSTRANDAWNPYVNSEFAKFQLTGLNENVSDAWKSLYNVVSMTTETMDNVRIYSTGAVSESVKQQAYGECYLLRAMAYFYLLRGWGDIVLYDNNQEIIDQPIRPLTKEKDVLRFIVRDLRRAVENLPEKGTDNHPSRYAAKAVLAKVLLAQSGWDNGGQRDEAILREVVSLCDEVINCGQYALMDDYEELFRMQNNDNPETILALRWAKPSSNEYGSMNATYSDLAPNDISDDVNVWGGSLCPSPDMIDYYNEEPADSFRLRGTFFTYGRHYDYLWTDKGGFTYKKNWMQVKKGVLGRKADVNGELDQMASPLNTYLMRLADVYLTKAEALLGNQTQTSDAEALKAFNATRLRAKLPAKSSFTFEDLIRERRIEFCMEYMNWFDMVVWYRWKPQYMLNFFNNVQHRAFEIRENDILKNDDGTFSYRCYLNNGTDCWYFADWVNNAGGTYWNDFMALNQDVNATNVLDNGNIIKTKDEGYVYDLNALVRANTNMIPITLSEANIFMPYPETDVIQNPYFKQPAVDYDFGSEK
ncbi:MAG: RagB/SusD family nutrient uptake outer membrane protein [Prevotella sp.]|nr:RagB/SusD family nutrient uptake outer membrane protein [Prevotella sp.]